MIRFCTRHYKIHILMKNFMVILLSIFSNFSVIASSPYNHHPSPAPILAFMSLYRLSPSQITSLPTLVITNHSLHRLWSLQTTLFTGFRPYKQLSSPAFAPLPLEKGAHKLSGLFREHAGSDDSFWMERRKAIATESRKPPLRI